jgi:Cu(I)/Ag(I) efflux system membrane fusion protein
VKKWAYASLVLAALAFSFLLGTRWKREPRAEAGARRVLYYVDPMHPAYKSSTPGIAPDCGMELEPVYADGTGTATAESAQVPSGTLQISPDKQQLLGIRTVAVEKSSGVHRLRVLGRVLPDETRVYRVNTGVSGFVRNTENDSVGTRVKRDQLLATYYSQELLGIQQSYTAGGERAAPPVRVVTDSTMALSTRLNNLGLGIDILSPADGVILARNISVGQRFEKGAELYRIADLKHVWVVAELFENESPAYRPGFVGMINRIIDFSVEHKLAVMATAPPASPDGGRWSRCLWMPLPT